MSNAIDCVDIITDAITQLAGDTIVRASNESLLGGDRVGGRAIKTHPLREQV